MITAESEDFGTYLKAYKYEILTEKSGLRLNVRAFGITCDKTVIAISTNAPVHTHPNCVLTPLCAFSADRVKLPVMGNPRKHELKIFAMPNATSSWLGMILY